MSPELGITDEGHSASNSGSFRFSSQQYVRKISVTGCFNSWRTRIAAITRARCAAEHPGKNTLWASSASPGPLLRGFYFPHFTPRHRTFDVLVCCLQGFLLAVVDEIRRGDDSVAFPKDVKAPHELYLSQSTFQPPGKPGVKAQPGSQVPGLESDRASLPEQRANARPASLLTFFR